MAEHYAADHFSCKPEAPDHDCSCHIAPPCSACVECPAWDEEGED